MFQNTVFSAVLLALVLFAYILQSYLRLRHVPGPFLAAFTDLWRFYAMNTKQHGERMIQLHRKYGPLIRTGPNCVSVSDPHAVQIVFGTSPVWQKVCETSYFEHLRSIR